MNSPEAVRKHDGRIVAYEANKLASSIARAACASEAALLPDAAKRLGAEIAAAAGAFLIKENKLVPASADIRAMVVKVLRETRQELVAAAYADQARAAAGLLWRIRVVEPGTPFTSPAGQPWDRRRLLESFRASGVARDPAGEAAKEVERRIVALGQERISPALIHSVGAMVLAQRALDVRRYNARRVACSLAHHVPHFDPLAAEYAPLPKDGPTLEALWMQAVHSPDVVRAAKDNILALEPLPSSPGDDAATPNAALAADPLLPELAMQLRGWCGGMRKLLWVRADGVERAAELARFIAMISASLAPAPGYGKESEQSMTLLLRLPAQNGRSRADGSGTHNRVRALGRALPVTVNIAGLMIREALRDPQRATVRLSRAASLAAQVHREREEYFQLSPVRGRQLPVAVAGLWNAVAWVQGESFGNPLITRASRNLAETFVSVLRGALETLRNETGMELCLVGQAPQAAAHILWQRDREYFLRDGINLDANAAYDGGPALSLTAGAADLGERLDFAKTVGQSFDDPPALRVEIPIGDESDPAVWREFFSTMGQAGISRLDLIPGGSSRALKHLIRATRSHLDCFPLFEQIKE